MSQYNSEYRQGSNYPNQIQNSNFSNQGSNLRNSQPGFNPVQSSQNKVVTDFALRKLDQRFMGENLDVVCFLMAVEIERLHDEAFKYKMHLEQHEDGKLEIKGLEAQIDELSLGNNEKHQQIKQLSQENQSYRTELDNLRNQFSNFQKERDGEHQKLQQILADKHRENQDLLGHVDNHSKNLQQKHIENQELLAHKENMGKEIDKYQRNMNQQYQETADWKNKHAAMENQHQTAKISLAEYENRFAMLSSEIERLGITLKTKSDECNEKQNQLMQLAEMQKKMEYQLVTQRTENEHLTNTIRQYQDTIGRQNEEKNRMQQTINQLRQLEDKVIVLDGEIDRLTEVNRDLNQESAVLKQNYVRVNELETINSNHLVTFVLLFTEIESLRTRMRQKDREVDEMRKASLAPYRN